MPVSLEKSHKISKRRSLTYQLFTLGLSITEVASCSGLTGAQARLDRESFVKEDGKFPSTDWENLTSERRVQLAREYAFAKYAYLNSRPHETFESREFMPIKKTLEIFLDIDKFREYCFAVAAMVNMKVFPTEEEEFVGYRLLLDEVLGRLVYRITGEVVFEEYFFDVFEHSVIANFDDLLTSLLMWAELNYSQDYVLPLTHTGVRLIEEVLWSIEDDRDLKILKMTYGIGFAKVFTNAEIASETKLSKSRPLQLRRKMIRKLLKADNMARLKILTKSPEALQDEVVKRNMLPCEVQSANSKKMIDMTLEQFLAEYLENFGIRTYNALQDSNIKTVRELVGKTRSQMLKISCFGLNQFNEVADVLKIDRLYFGMML